MDFDPTGNAPDPAFEDSTGHLLAELERMSLVLEGYRRTLDRSHHSGEFTTGSDLNPRACSPAIPPDVRTDVEDRASAIEARVATTPADTPLRLQHLVDSFDLADPHRDVLLLALLPTIFPDYQSVFAELHNDLSATQPTVGLVADLYSATDAEFLAAMRLVGTESPLREHDLVRIGQPDDTRIHRTDRPVFLEERIESYLLGGDAHDPLLEPVLETVSADRTLDELRLNDDLRTRLAAIPWDSDTSRRFYWHGPSGTGKRRAVEAVCPNGSFLRADLPAVINAELLDRLRREAIITDLPVHLESVSAATAAPDAGRTIDDVISAFEAHHRPIVLTGTEEWTPKRIDTPSVTSIIEFSRPEFDIRRAFWEAHADDLPADLDPVVLAGTFELTLTGLEAALETAQTLSGENPLTAAHVYAGCRAQSAGGLADLAEQLDPDATWADIHLPASTMRNLRIVATHVTHKGRIYHEWGFQKRFSRGTGIVALFSGPSGTGKTLAAEIIAADVGMDLYKIDLSSVVSKYIGETEENLERIFTQAEHSNAILLFDEADAVFGDRAAVSDASDRYANVEVNYLLQRIESYGGMVLLTTNYESNIDSAFMRRIDHVVQFQRPDEAIRTAIWESIFPEEAPTAALDEAFLAGFKLTGGDIRTIAQTAAILAAEAGETITMKHVVRALQRELRKNAKMLDPQEFGPYREYLHRE